MILADSIDNRAIDQRGFLSQSLNVVGSVSVGTVVEAAVFLGALDDPVAGPPALRRHQAHGIASSIRPKSDECHD